MGTCQSKGDSKGCHIFENVWLLTLHGSVCEFDIDYKSYFSPLKPKTRKLPLSSSKFKEEKYNYI